MPIGLEILVASNGTSWWESNADGATCAEDEIEWHIIEPEGGKGSKLSPNTLGLLYKQWPTWQMSDFDSRCLTVFGWKFGIVIA